MLNIRIATLYLIFALAVAASAGETAGTIVMENPEIESDSIHTRFANLVYREAFAALGYKYETRAYPTLRAIAMIEQGHLDGFVHRVAVFQELYPILVRVEEPVSTLELAAYSRHPELRITQWHDLKDTSYLVSYHAGVQYLSKILTQFVAAANLDEVSPYTGLQQLLAGHTDVYIGVEGNVRLLLTEAAFRDKGIRALGIIDSQPLYPYLHRKHTALAVRLAEELRRMKAAGRFAYYQTLVVPSP